MSSGEVTFESDCPNVNALPGVRALVETENDVSVSIDGCEGECVSVIVLRSTSESSAPDPGRGGAW